MIEVPEPEAEEALPVAVTDSEEDEPAVAKAMVVLA